MDSPRVHVVYPNGFEQLGIALSSDTLEVGPHGEPLKPGDIIEVDGVKRTVNGIKQIPANTAGGTAGSLKVTRIRHEAL